MQLFSFVKKSTAMKFLGFVCLALFLNIQSVKAQGDALVGVNASYLTSAEAQVALSNAVADLRAVSPLSYTGLDEATIPMRIQYYQAVYNSITKGSPIQEALIACYDKTLVPHAARFKPTLVTPAVVADIVSDATNLVSQ